MSMKPPTGNTKNSCGVKGALMTESNTDRVLADRAQYVDGQMSTLHQLVRAVWPGALGEGSLGSWSWTVDGQVVAEAWMHRRKPGWWLRIKGARAKDD